MRVMIRLLCLKRKVLNFYLHYRSDTKSVTEILKTKWKTGNCQRFHHSLSTMTFSNFSFRLFLYIHVLEEHKVVFVFVFYLALVIVYIQFCILLFSLNRHINISISPSHYKFYIFIGCILFHNCIPKFTEPSPNR